MNIVVCIKQVPNTTEVRIDPVKSTLVCTGVPSIMSPFDRNALETGLQLKDRHGGKMTVVSIGSPQAKAVLQEAPVMGVNEAYLIIDHVFGGFDAYATSYILSRAVKKLGGFDVILDGEQAIDGDTEQTAPNIAERLGAIRLTYILSMETEGGRMVVRRQVEEGVEAIEVSLPVLCIVAKESNKLRYATIKGVLNSLKAEIEEITLASLLDSDTTKMDLEGSPTKVKATLTPKRNANCINIESNSPAKIAGTLVDRLTEAKVF